LGCDQQIPEDTERAEDKALECYREAMNHELPSPLRAVVEGQYLGVQRNHTQIKALRDLERSHALNVPTAGISTAVLLWVLPSLSLPSV
jgi:hypothetical protein